jgi:hypothetical protein
VSGMRPVCFVRDTPGLYLAANLKSQKARDLGYFARLGGGGHGAEIQCNAKRVRKRSAPFFLPMYFIKSTIRAGHDFQLYFGSHHIDLAGKSLKQGPYSRIARDGDPPAIPTRSMKAALE